MPIRRQVHVSQRRNRYFQALPSRTLGQLGGGCQLASTLPSALPHPAATRTGGLPRGWPP